jgi:hypothetical protein
MHRLNIIEAANKFPPVGSTRERNKNNITKAAIKYSQETTENTFFFI